MTWSLLQAAAPQLDAGAAQSRLHLPADRLRHQGRPGAAACLAARCPCRRPDADFGGAVGSAAECRALCAAALQDAGRRPIRTAHRSRPDHDRHGAGLADLRGLHALPAARHQTAVRLLLDRAYGADHLRLRHGRAARQFRRAAAHGHAQPHQIGDLLRRRPCRAGQGHAAHRRHPRAERHPSRACRSVLRAGGARDLPACRRSACS